MFNNLPFLLYLSKKTYKSNRLKRTRLFAYGQLIVRLKHFFEAYRLPEFLDYNQDVIEKLFKTYIYARTSPLQRVELIENHYKIATNKFPINRLNELLHTRSSCVAKIDLPTLDKALEIRIGYDGRFKREGEWTLGLHIGAMLVYSVTFSFTYMNRNESIIIGCIQGADNREYPNAKDIIKNTTKAFFGLRPKDLIMLVLFKFAACVQIDYIYAVGSKKHAYRGILNRRNKSILNYDAIWLERGAKQTSNGLFLLPYPTRKDISEIDSKKRSMYRQRYELLDKMQDDIRLFCQQNSSAL